MCNKLLAKQIGLLSIGNELLDGRIQDTNAAFIGNFLRSKGLSLYRVLTVPDKVTEIVSGLNYLNTHVKVIIVSGGLGPTSDDLTREGVSSYVGAELVLDPSAEKQVRDAFARRNRLMPDNNLRQAYVPSGADIVANTNGTAPGFLCGNRSNNEPLIVALPGVPGEFEPMFSEVVWPQLSTQLELVSEFTESGFRLFGISESAIAQKIEALELESDISILYRTEFPEIEIILRNIIAEPIERAKEAIRQVLSENIFIGEPHTQSLPFSVCEKLLSENKQLSVAESCTAGLLSSLITDIPGASNIFVGGAITYSNEMKVKVLEVSEESLALHGAVSHEVAKEMASGVLKLSQSDYALSITGVAGPSGGSSEKPVGTFYVGLSDKNSTVSKEFRYSSTRANIRRYAAFAALNLLHHRLVPGK